MLCKDFPSDFGGFTGRRGNRSTVGPHNFTAERFLFIGNLDHIDQAIQSEICACHRKRSSPLPGSRLRCNPLQPLLFGIISLGNSRIQLMAAAGIITFKLVVNFRRRLQFFLQAISPHQGRGTVHFIKVLYLLRNRNICRGIIQFLRRQFITEDMLQLFRRHRLQCLRIQQRRGLILHVGTKVVPHGRNFAFLKIDFIGNFCCFAHCSLHSEIYAFLKSSLYFHVYVSTGSGISQGLPPDFRILVLCPFACQRRKTRSPVLTRFPHTSRLYGLKNENTNICYYLSVLSFSLHLDSARVPVLATSTILMV